MGLLDALFQSGGSGGGLLDFLKNNALNQQMPSGLPSDQAQYGSSPLGITPQAPIFQSNPTPPVTPQPQAPVAQPAPVQPQAPALAAAGPGMGDRFNASFQGFANSGGLLPAIANGIGGLMTGQRTDPAGVEDRRSAVAKNFTVEALRKRGVSEADIAASLSSPEYFKKILDNSVKEQDKFRPATADERAKAGLPVTAANATPLYINESTGEPKFGPPQTNVNVSTEKTGQAELVKQAVESHVAAQNAARESQKRVGLYDAMEKAAAGFTPGATAEMRLTAKRYLKDAGLIKGDDVPDGEIMQMISRTLAIHAQPKGQGAVSNFERDMFAKSLPNMTQSPEGLRMAINISRKLEQFDQQVAQIYRESAGANNGIPNYLQVQERIAKLGSPLGEKEMSAMGGGGSSPSKTEDTSSKPPPKIGEIRSGYRFKGGNPGIPSSWEAVS